VKAGRRDVTPHRQERLAFSNRKPGLVHAGNYLGLARSTDAGATCRQAGSEGLGGVYSAHAPALSLNEGHVVL
jgi:hypothetical protein